MKKYLKLKFVSLIVLVGPIITEEPQSQNVSIFIHNITLSCEAIGIPVPSIIWTHNDTTLNVNGEIGDFENGINIIESVETLGTIRSMLIIDSALANHTGNYSCNATSSVEFYESVMSQIALVLVQGKYIAICDSFITCDSIINCHYFNLIS